MLWRHAEDEFTYSPLGLGLSFEVYCGDSKRTNQLEDWQSNFVMRVLTPISGTSTSLTSIPGSGTPQVPEELGSKPMLKLAGGG
jgi:hypothetical protein